MASNREQKPCIGCEKGVATCSGCEKHFCLPHFTEHRQELDKRMDEVMHEHDQLLEALKPQGTVHPLMSQIDTWEQASIQKIKDTAKQAREDLQVHLDCSRDRLTDSLGNIAQQLKSNQASTVYTEKELDEWLRQLKQMQQTLEKSPNIDVIKDEEIHSSIHMIKVLEKFSTEEHLMGNKAATQSELASTSMSISTGSFISHFMIDNPSGYIVNLKTPPMKYLSN
ncbi:unnamed protein product [Adineta steineri]|uniref:B box-type domain-containing protein n=1 Tax=Adineta steineri TaxID=433720 RepID=A0A819U0N9_9BILA|nr:unnamed protein product [Adineta steineri]CAF0930858.1 unnamed protein product [Adineta steineri]CAF3864125.1 unnamed protein product [Adineta steineri]CAF4095632.1 unnamed protein product [Adineta steineri]